MAFIERSTILGLDDYWDEEQASWGHAQKVPLDMTNAWALVHRTRSARSRRSINRSRSSTRCGAASTSTRPTATGSTRTSRSS